MQRLLISTAMLGMALLAGAPAQAQTTIKITMPDSSSCVYPTGPVSSNATPGQLQATASANGTGSGCGGPAGSGPVSFGPASQMAPPTVSLPSSPTGESTSLTFQAVNAVSCTGSITGASGGTISGGSTICSSASTCLALQTVNVSFPENTSTTGDNVYTVSATCTAAGGLGTSSSSVVTVKPKGVVVTGSCPKLVPSATTGITSFVSASTLNVDYNSGGVQAKDTSLFSNVFYTSTTGELPWPGRYGLNTIISLPKTKYISMQFTVPANFMTASNAPANLYGQYTVGETGFAGSGPVSMTISAQCGDFANPTTGSSVIPGCWKNKLTSDQPLSWTKASSCQLVGGSTYFLNIINADIANLTASGGTATSTAGSQCLGGSCTVPIKNGDGTWLGYTPN